MINKSKVLEKILAATIILISVFLLAVRKSPKVVEDPYLKGFTEDNIKLAGPAIQMYFYIKKYSKEYSVPEHFLFSVAFLESTYRGPLDSSWRGDLISPAGALGPMQIMPSTANFMHGKLISRYKLKNDIEFNVKTSLMLISQLHKKYENWGVVFGYYNTGRPIVNGYAKKILKNEYRWIKSDSTGKLNQIPKL